MPHAKLTTEQIAAIRARANAATKGPWSVLHLRQCVRNLSERLEDYQSGADIVFASMARTDVPELLDALDAANARVAQLEAALAAASQGDDICGLCGLPGADKYKHPVRWPSERNPDGQFVHAECESAECGRAHAALTQEQRDSFLRTL